MSETDPPAFAWLPPLPSAKALSPLLFAGIFLSINLQTYLCETHKPLFYFENLDFGARLQIVNLDRSRVDTRLDAATLDHLQAAAT